MNLNEDQKQKISEVINTALSQGSYLNDSRTRSCVKESLSAHLGEVVICDESNNTPDIIDSNSLVAEAPERGLKIVCGASGISFKSKMNEE